MSEYTAKNPRPNPDSVIFDIDGTLADCDHRREHITCKPKNWKRFNELMCDDTPKSAIARMVRLFNHSGWKIVLCSGREEVYRDVTENWLREHHVPYAALYMRPAKDYRADDIVKSELLDRILADDWRPWLVVDDRDRVVKMWRARGLTCLQCAPGDF